MRILIFISLLMSLAYSQPPSIEPGVSQELARWRAARYSDVRYKLNLTLEKMSPVLKGTIEARVNLRRGEGETPERGETPIILDWRKIKGFEDRSTISNVSINGRGVVRVTPSGANSAAPSSTQITPEGVTLTNLTFEESNEHLIFRDGVVAGENVIKLDFTSPILPSGSATTRYIDKEDGSEYIYSLFVPSDASTAFPVFDQPDLKATFHLDVDVPRDWKVVSNARTLFSAAKVIGDSAPDKSKHPPIPPGLYRYSFLPTKPISTYVFAVAAGPFHLFGEVASFPGIVRSEDEPEPKKGEGDYYETIRPRIYVRKSQQAKFQPHAAEVFRLNREAIKYFEDYFDYKFPFPKYDLVLIPEFPFGGMEHAGATFLREAGVIFPQEPTKNDHITRATLIFHEAAHQWFGDTVTMRWFDDLWLKEGFATFTAYKAMEKIMPEMNSWKVFYERIKQGAYQTDSTKGTTAIYQPIANLSAAKSAYGNIVYNKAPAFLRQAEFYIGEDKFRAAVRSFLKKHEFGNAGWEDLVKEFEGASGQHLKHWAEQWVTQRGLPIYRVSVTPPGSRYQQTEFKATSSVEPNSFWKQRAETMTDGAREGRRISKLDLAPRFRGDFIGFDRTVSHGTIQTELFFPNYGDYGYGIFLLDDKSRDYVLKNIHNEKDPFLRSMMWGALWDSVREGELDPKEYVELVIKVQSNAFTRDQRSQSSTGSTPKGVTLTGDVTLTDDESTTAMILNRVSTAMTYYMSEPPAVAGGLTRGSGPARGGKLQPPTTAGGSDLRDRVENLLIEKMRTAPILGQRITFYRAFLNVASSEKAREVLKEMLRQKSVPSALADGSQAATRHPSANTDGTDSRRRVDPVNAKLSGIDIPLKTKDRFDIVTKLASLGDPDAEKLLVDLEKTETSDDAKRYAYAARAAFPTKETKEKYWNDFVNNKQLSESWIEAAFVPFNSVRHADLTRPYLERALKELPNHKRNRKIFFVNGWLGSFIGGQRSEEALAIINKFLADNPNLDRDLRLKILENVDVIERAVKIRGKFGAR